MSAAPEPPPARLIAIGGLSGTGKSTLARALAAQFPGTTLLRSDVERKLQCGVVETTRLGPEGYTPDVTARVYRALGGKAAAALAVAATVVVDAVFARHMERADIEAVARAADASFTGLWLEASQAVQIARVEARRDDASDATAEIVARQAAYDLGPITWHRIDASRGADHTLAAALAIVDASVKREPSP